MKSLEVCENAREAIETVEWSALTSGLYAVEAHEGHGRSAVYFLVLEGEEQLPSVELQNTRGEEKRVGRIRALR